MEVKNNMKVEQVYELVNKTTQEILGDKAPTVGGDNLTKLVDVGKELFDNTDVENYMGILVDHIGRMIFVNRPYSGRAPSVRMDDWEFGSIMEKIDAGIPEAKENKSWKLVDGTTYNQDIFNKPKDVKVKFFNDRVTFDIEMSFVDRQIKSAFSNVNQLNAFFSMIYTKIETSMIIKLDSLIMATINNFIANVYLNGTSAQKINIAQGYTETSLSALFKNPNFIRDAAYHIKLASDHMTNISKLFNIGKRVRHTEKSRQKIILLSDFAAGADIYLQSDTFHNELTKLPNADRVSFWQYSGDNFSIDEISAIDVIPNTPNGAGSEVKINGILSVIFDREALGVNNFNRRTTSHYNAAAEFLNMWYKMDAQYFNDFDENFILIYAELPKKARNVDENKVDENKVDKNKVGS